MNTMKLNLLLILAALSLTACGKQMKDFVIDGSKNPNDPTKPIITIKNTSGVKVSPGAGKITGTQVDGRVTITPTYRLVKGSQVQGRVTISQGRPQ